MSHAAKAPPMHLAGQGVTRFRWFIAGLLFLATTINYIDRQILALLKPILDQELGWTNEEFGWVNSTFFGFYVASDVIFGWFIDKVGVKFGFSVSILWWSLAAIAYANTSKVIEAVSGIAGMAGAVGGMLFPVFAGTLLDHFKGTSAGESAGYAILFAMCGSAYVVVFLINHVFAPRFEQIDLGTKA